MTLETGGGCNGRVREGADKLLDCITHELGGGVTFASVGAGATRKGAAGGFGGAPDGTLTTPRELIPGETPPEDCMTQEFGGLPLIAAGD